MPRPLFWGGLTLWTDRAKGECGPWRPKFSTIQIEEIPRQMVQTSAVDLPSAACRRPLGARRQTPSPPTCWLRCFPMNLNRAGGQPLSGGIDIPEEDHPDLLPLAAHAAQAGPSTWSRPSGPPGRRSTTRTRSVSPAGQPQSQTRPWAQGLVTKTGHFGTRDHDLPETGAGPVGQRPSRSPVALIGLKVQGCFMVPHQFSAEAVPQDP